MKQNRNNILLVVILIVMGAGTRMINAGLHMPNYAPLVAISLFAGAVLKDKKWLAFAVPVLGQLLADVCFGLFTQIPAFYGVSGMLFNYGALALATLLGTKTALKPAAAIGGTFAAACVFFMVSNFGFFAEGWNGYSASGLMKTYVDGLPFFKYTVEGNMVACVLLFGAWFLVPRAATAKTAKA